MAETCRHKMREVNVSFFSGRKVGKTVRTTLFFVGKSYSLRVPDFGVFLDVFA